MAPSSGYHMVPKAVQAVKYAISRSSDFVRARLLSGSKPLFETVPVPTHGQPIHPLALLRQSRARISSGRQQTRFFSTVVSRLVRSPGVSASARTFTPSGTRTALRAAKFAPFASPLRPNLTGGALPRSAGGYGLGGGGLNSARHFSHTSSAQAHVVQNVHGAVRAFLLQGHKPLYAGSDPRTGAARFRAVGPAEAQARTSFAKGSQSLTSPWEMRGTSLDFHVAPTITALSARDETESSNLAALTDDVVRVLATDFAYQLRDLAAVHADLKRLGQLGELPIAKPDSATIRVRFPGCDAAAVVALCNEVGVTRGVVREDPGWDEQGLESESDSKTQSRDADRDVEMALLFPWAPTEHSRGPYMGSASALSSDGRGREYFEHNPTRPLVEDLEWHSMLSIEATSNAQPRDAPHISSSPNSPHSFVPLSAPSQPQSVSRNPEYLSSPDFDFESLAASEAVSEDDDRHLAPARTLTQTAPPRPTGYEGVEGIYRFLRELESAEGRTRY